MFKKDFHKLSAFLFSAFLAVFFLVGSTGSALAQAATLGDVICSIYDNIHGSGASGFGLNDLFCWVAYAAGAVFVVQSIYHFKLHAENPGNHSLYRPVAQILGGAALMATPGVADVLIKSLYGTTGSGGVTACAAGAAGSTASGGGLDDMLINFVGNIGAPMQTIISAVAILSGIFMIVHGLMKASKYGYDPKANSIHHVLTLLGFGAMLITIGDNLDMMLGTVFGGGSTGNTVTNTLSWSIAGVSPRFQAAVNAGLQFFQIIGAIAFVRGWMILKKVFEGGGEGKLAQGMTHILGGVIAVNIFAFLKLMDTTFGTGLLN